MGHQETKCGIYQISINNHKYIGRSNNIRKRFVQHLCNLKANRHHSIILQRCFNKYGVNSIKFDILELCDHDKLIEREQYYVDLIKPDCNIGVCTDGGDNISNHPNKAEIVMKIQNASINRFKTMPKKEKELLSKNMLGSKNPNYGNKWTKEQKEKASKTWQDKYKNGYKSPSLGKKLSKKHKKLISIAASKRVKEKNPFYGKTHSKESKNKMRIKMLGKLPINTMKVIIDGIIYKSASDAARILGITAATVLNRCRSLKFSNYQVLNSDGC